MSQKQDKFDLKIVHDKFEESLLENDDVDIENYMKSFDELNKFFDLMGTIFGFVSQDLKDKMEILRNYRRSNDTSSQYYDTVKKMIEYEKQNDLLNKTDFVSGSRTLLRIHRGLDFIRLFLQKVGEIEHHETTSTVCRESYDQTLAKHHGWFIRQGAKVAMYTLPTKEALLTRVCGDTEDVLRAIEVLPKTLEASDKVYRRIEGLYTYHDLHNLP